MPAQCPNWYENYSIQEFYDPFQSKHQKIENGKTTTNVENNIISPIISFGIQIYANTLFSTSSTSKIILCIQLKIDHFKLTTHTVQSVSQYYSFMQIFFLTLNFFNVVNSGQKKIYCQIQSNNPEKMKSLCLPSLCTKNDFLPYLLHKISYLYTFHSMNYGLF